jgi:hypothetical protein
MIGRGFYGKLFMQLVDPEEGPSSDPAEWFNITKTISDHPELGDPEQYLFGDFAFIDDATCLLSYIHYAGRVGAVDDDGYLFREDGYGVLRGVLQGWGEIEGVYQPVWHWEEWSDGLPSRDNGTTFVSEMLHNSYRGDRIFLAAARQHNEGGGLYVLEPANSATWEAIYDGDYLDGCAGDCADDDPECNCEEPTDVNRYRDFRALAESRDGSWLYVGTRGLSSGIGGLLLCTDTSRAAEVGALEPDEPLPAVLEKWEILANDPDDTITPFEFDEDLPFWSEDFPYMAAPQNINKRITFVSSLAVDRWDKAVIYVGLSEEGMSSREGLWRYDGESWEHLSQERPFTGIGVKVLETNFSAPGQLLIGTDGQGLYIRNPGQE